MQFNAPREDVAVDMNDHIALCSFKSLFPDLIKSQLGRSAAVCRVNVTIGGCGRLKEMTQLLAYSALDP